MIMPTAAGLLDSHAHFLHWGVIQISLANLIVISLMLIVFGLAVLFQFRRHGDDADASPVPEPAPPATSEPPTGTSRSWTVRLRTRLQHTVPAGQVLPDRQPAYVRSWIYVFGVASLAAFLWAIASGTVLAVKGATWWHTSSLGHFVNSTHLWSVELFFFCMVVHLWGKFFMAAWRGNRRLTWVTGGIAFVGSIGTAFTGYLSQTNFDSQWTAGQAKDGLNAVGIGSVFNVLNTGQMLLWHVMLLPLLLGVLIVLHVILVRRHGVVPPFDAAAPEFTASAAPGGTR